MISPAASNEGFQRSSDQWNCTFTPTRTVAGLRQVLPPKPLMWYVSPTAFNFCFPEAKECDPLAPGRQKMGSFPDEPPGLTAPRSGATRMLRLHVPIFKQEKIKIKECVLDLYDNFQVTPGCSSQYWMFSSSQTSGPHFYPKSSPFVY